MSDKENISSPLPEGDRIYEQQRMEMLLYLTKHPDEFSDEQQRVISMYADRVAKEARQKWEALNSPDVMRQRAEGAARLLVAIGEYTIGHTELPVIKFPEPIIPEADEQRAAFISGVETFVNESSDVQRRYARTAILGRNAPMLLLRFGVIDGINHTEKELGEQNGISSGNVAKRLKEAVFHCHLAAQRNGNTQFNTLLQQVGLPHLPQARNQE